MTPASKALALAASLLLPVTAALADNTDALLQRLLAQTQEIENSGAAAQPEAAKPESPDALLKLLFENLHRQTAELDALTSGSENQPTDLSAQPAPVAATAASPRSGELQSSRLESSGSLQGAHLRGYPALPDIEPTSSILEPTAAQLQHDRDVDAVIEKRKQFFQQNPASTR